MNTEQAEEPMTKDQSNDKLTFTFADIKNKNNTKIVDFKVSEFKIENEEIMYSKIESVFGKEIKRKIKILVPSSSFYQEVSLFFAQLLKNEILSIEMKEV